VRAAAAVLGSLEILAALLIAIRPALTLELPDLGCEGQQRVGCGGPAA
jgi:hypothetical protein